MSLAICDFELRCLRLWAQTSPFCRISGDLAPSTRKTLAIAIVRFWCANRRESSGGMEWLGVWNCIFSGSEISNFRAWNLAKIALSAEFQGFFWKFRPLKTIFRTLENGHSIRHQSIPPLSAGRAKQKIMHSFRVQTPTWQMAPVSRAHGEGGDTNNFVGC